MFARALNLVYQDVLEHHFVQGKVGHITRLSRMFSSCELFEFSYLFRLQTLIVFLPPKKGLFRDPDLAVQINHRCSQLPFFNMATICSTENCFHFMAYPPLFFKGIMQETHSVSGLKTGVAIRSSAQPWLRPAKYKGGGYPWTERNRSCL